MDSQEIKEQEPMMGEEGEQEETESNEGEIAGEHDFEDMMEDTYGMAITSLIRDLRDEGKGVAKPGLRIGRMVFSFMLLFICVWVQCYLMREIKKFVTAKAVHSIRENYEAYERVMYANHVMAIPEGHGLIPYPSMLRGIDGPTGKWFDKARFDLLKDDVKKNACRIPFSQPTFYYCILCIWSLTVIGDVKDTMMLFIRLVSLPTVRSMNDATVVNEDGDAGELTVVGLVMWVKVVIGGAVILPRLLIAFVLLWLGCRWLTATANFNDLLLNAVALEFVLVLKDLLYNTLVPERNKRETGRTKIDVSKEVKRPSFITFFGTFALGAIVVAWVAFYTQSMQVVLPEYNWDVHDVCVEWISKKYKV